MNNPFTSCPISHPVCDIGRGSVALVLVELGDDEAAQGLDTRPADINIERHRGRSRRLTWSRHESTQSPSLSGDQSMLTIGCELITLEFYEADCEECNDKIMQPNML